MGKLSLRPSQFEGLFGDTRGVFLHVTSKSVREHLDVHPDPETIVVEYTWQGQRSLQGLLGRLAYYSRSGHTLNVLWTAASPPPPLGATRLQGAKLGVVYGLELTPSKEAIAATLEIITKTDHQREQMLERTLLFHLDGGLRITLNSNAHKTSATFYHRAVEQWRSLHGTLSPGEQTLLPTGELTAVVSDPEVLEGELLIKGTPVITRGTASASPQDANALFDLLASAKTHAIIATIKESQIEHIRDPAGEENPLLEALETLFEKDPRYRQVHRLSFGTNPGLGTPAPGNFPANRRYPGVHIGLGAPERTGFLIDMMCEDVDAMVEFQDGDLLDLYEELGFRQDLSDF